MKFPDHVYCLGEKFRVELVPDLHSGDERVSGETVGEYKRIRIDAGLDTARQWQVLLHEFIHATLHVMGAGNYLHADVEESIAQSMEFAISQLIKQHGQELTKVMKKES